MMKINISHAVVLFALYLPVLCQAENPAQAHPEGVQGSGGRQSPSSKDMVIEFRNKAYPDFIESISGIEETPQVINKPGDEFNGRGGRWTDASQQPTVTLVFKNDLPKKFNLMVSAAVLDENKGKAILIKVGGQQKKVSIPPKHAYVLGSNVWSFATLDIPISLGKLTRQIEIVPPNPIDMAGKYSQNDHRKISLFIESLKVVPK